MTTYNTPKKNTAYRTFIELVDQSNTKLFKANPTIASGDFKVSIDGAAFANLTTLPSAVPSGGRAVQIDLSSSEMNGDSIIVQCVDAAGAEWCDFSFNLSTTVRQIDDLAYPATSGRSLAVSSSGVVDSNLVSILATALTETVGGYLSAAFKKLFDVVTPVFTSASVNQTGDNYARIGAPAGASISADIAAVKSETDTILTDVNTGGGAIYTRLGSPAGASIAADIAAAKVDTAAVKIQTDKLVFTTAGRVDANMEAIHNDTTAAINLQENERCIGTGIVGAGSTTTSIVCSSFTPTLTDADQLAGHYLVFMDNVGTAAMQIQATSITHNTTGSTPSLTVPALTRAPASGDKFKVF